MSGATHGVARRARPIAAAAALLLAAAGGAHAQVAPAAAGARVRLIDARGHVTIEGRLSRVTADTLYLRAWPGLVAVDRSTLTTVQKNVGRPDLVVHMLTGAVALGIVGSLYGHAHPLASHVHQCLTPGTCIERAVNRRGAETVYGAGGAMVGALVGAVLSPSRWVAAELVERRR